MICCHGITEGGITEGREIIDELLPKLSCVELKSSERGGLLDRWEHQSYQGGNVLGARSSL